MMEAKALDNRGQFLGGRKLWLQILLGMTALLLLFGSEVTIAKQAKIKEPAKLGKTVKFWEYVFSELESNHFVIHDRQHPYVIYQERAKYKGGRRTRLRRQRQAKERVAKALKVLSKTRRPKGSYQRKIWKAIPKNLRNRKFLAKAHDRVRLQLGVATSFRSSLKRSKRYLPMIKSQLRRKRLPMELAYLPHLESGFNTKAHSKVGARGLWQLMKSTARPFMRVTRRRDDRVNAYKSTKVAVKLLQRNYQMTRSWPLAITGYNYGINGIMRAIKKHGTNDYMALRKRHKTRIFGFAAKNFFPSFLAVRNLAMKAAKGQRLADKS